MNIGRLVFGIVNLVASLPLIYMTLTYWFRRDFVWERQVAYDKRKGNPERERTRAWDVRIMLYGATFFILAFVLMVSGLLALVS